MRPIAHRQVAVLVVSDPTALREIEGVVPLERYVLARISDKELVVDPATVADLYQRLSERGITPMMKKRGRSGTP
jgi:hypothetical protein